MIMIKEIVNQAIALGYLSVKAQNQIRNLMQSNYDSEDLDALIILQRSVMSGEVKQESISRKNDCSLKDQDTASNLKLAYQIAAEMAFAAAIALTMSNNS